MFESAKDKRRDAKNDGNERLRFAIRFDRRPNKRAAQNSLDEKRPRADRRPRVETAVEQSALRRRDSTKLGDKRRSDKIARKDDRFFKIPRTCAPDPPRVKRKSASQNDNQSGGKERRADESAVGEKRRVSAQADRRSRGRRPNKQFRDFDDSVLDRFRKPTFLQIVSIHSVQSHCVSSSSSIGSGPGIPRPTSLANAK